MIVEFTCETCTGTGRVGDQRCEACLGKGVIAPTIRDLFAAFALIGVASFGDPKSVALKAYQLANEMLKARRV